MNQTHPVAVLLGASVCGERGVGLHQIPAVYLHAAHSTKQPYITSNDVRALV